MELLTKRPTSVWSWPAFVDTSPLELEGYTMADKAIRYTPGWSCPALVDRLMS